MKKIGIQWSYFTIILLAVMSSVLVACSKIGDEVDEQIAKANTPSDTETVGKYFREPCTEWGVAKQVVKTYMKNYELSEEKDTLLYYKPTVAEAYSAYFFVKSKLRTSLICIGQSVVSLDALKSHYTDLKYIQMQTADRSEATFLSENKATQVSIMKNDDIGCFFIYYIDYKWASGYDDSKYYEAPFLDWGTERSAVKDSLEAHGYILKEDVDDASKHYYLLYHGKWKEQLSMYYFDADQLLYQVSFAFTQSLNEVRNYVGSISSKMIAEDNGVYYYQTKDGKSLIAVYSKDDIVYVYYKKNN